MTAHQAGIGDDSAAAGQSELFFEMVFFGGRRGQTFHAVRDFYQTFLALALLAAGSGNFYSERFRIIEQRSAGRDLATLIIEMQLHAHVVSFAFACDGE